MPLGQLVKVDDPRDPLEKARRADLIAYAKAQGFYGNIIHPDMPAILIRRRFRERGIHRIPANFQPLGGLAVGQSYSENGGPPAVTASDGPAVDAEAELERQFRTEVEKPLHKMSRSEMQHLAKERGVKYGRTDNTPTLRAKLIAAELEGVPK